jgi:glycosyltransferase involved in cell wall biosynthesis
MKVAFIAPGLHRVNRGAEVAFESIGRELNRMHQVEVTLFGSGQTRVEDSYHFCHVSNIPREKFETWPKFPLLRNEYVYEELTFASSLARCYQPKQFDVVVSYSYPFTNWLINRRGGKHRPRHIYVTQNGDWEIKANHSEWRYFSCDGLVCTNPKYYKHHCETQQATLIPNGIDVDTFKPGKADRATFGLPEGVPVALMVSALIPSKRVCEGIEAAAKVDDLYLVVCGDGPERDKVKALGQKLMPNRFRVTQLPRQQMPDMYRSADLLLHMSLDEPFGNVYIEASAIGLPVVAHNWSGTQWILGDTATLVDTQELVAVTQGIKSALKMNSETLISKRISMVKSRFSWEKISLLYYDFFKEILDARTLTVTV